MYVIKLLLSLYLLVLIARLILDWVLVFARSYRPRGVMAVLFEVVFTLTDPPLRFLRRFIPPLRLGNFSLDLSFLLLIIGLQIVIDRIPG